MIAGIILAAGASSRMGRPKALLDFHGETFLDRLIRLMQHACDTVVVVLGYHADEIRARTKSDATFVVNPDPDRGQLSSLQTGLAVLFPAQSPGAVETADYSPSHKGGATTTAPYTGLLFLPVDCPAVRGSTIQKVANEAARRTRDTLFVIPRCGDRRGHPVFAARTIADELLALPPTSAARDVVHKYVPQTRYLDVDDPGILSDIDDPESYRRLMEPQS